MLRPVHVLLRLAMFVAVLIGLGARGAEEDRIWVEATVNGKPARLYFDTGACGLNLHSQGATRLGLSFVPPPDASPDPFLVPRTRSEECDFQFAGGRIRTTFLVARIPNAVNPTEDGSVGWKSEVFAHKVLRLDPGSAAVTVLRELPAEVAAWTKWKVRTNGCIVALEIPNRGGNGSFVNLDTGSPAGVMLAPDNWREWKRSHPNRAKTLNAYYTKGTGLVVAEEAWAREIILGPLVLKDVPVMEANKADVALSGVGFEATLGLAALRRFDLIIDGKQLTAYLRPSQPPPTPYVHNCLGAVFTPEDLLTYGGENLLAHVAPGSPAFLAGIHDGDVLLKYNDLDVTGWRNQPTLIPSFRSASNGPPVRLTLSRAGKTFTVDVELKPILVPRTTAVGRSP